MSPATTSVISPGARGQRVPVARKWRHATGMLHRWSGWPAYVDGARVPLRTETEWLAIDLPVLEHEVRFRYRPWDVPLGELLFLVRIVWAARIWVRGDE